MFPGLPKGGVLALVRRGGMVLAMIDAAGALPAQAQHDMSGMAMPSQAMPAPAPTPPAAASPATSPPSASVDHDATPGMAMDHATMPGMAMPGGSDWTGGSGTSRLPAADGGMHGLHAMAGGWMLMAHGYLWGVYSDQGGPRGTREAFVESMAMLEASRDLTPTDRLQLRAMLSLEPAMGARGYPNLFATGEVADGRPLIDRQHPHDLFMELSARIDHDVAPGTSLFLYGGPVAEPALGPSAFMHRGSDRYLPLSPITHHWFDSTHITYGVVTAGVSSRHWQLEASGFRGREPDEHRCNLETPGIDSWSVRATWTPTPNWAVQVSHGRLHSPEQDHPGDDEARTTASIHYARGPLQAMLAFAAKNRLPGRTLTAWLAEANYDVTRRDVVFGRVENVANDELFPAEGDPLHDQAFRVTRVEGGYARRIPLGSFELALGGTIAAYGKPRVLDAAYGRAPISGTLFARLSLGQ